MNPSLSPLKSKIFHPTQVPFEPSRIHQEIPYMKTFARGKTYDELIIFKDDLSSPSVDPNKYLDPSLFRLGDLL